MMFGRIGASRLIIGAAVGTFVLWPAHGSAQDSPSGWCAEVDLESPLEDLIRCATEGDASAQYRVGLRYEFGSGDLVEAVRWFRLAAEQGYAPGQLSMGLAYRDGRGVATDLAYADMWFTLSAVQGAPVNPARSNKELIERLMTSEQIAEAEKLTREWIANHPNEGGN
jgi:TPR repeat protein